MTREQLVQCYRTLQEMADELRAAGDHGATRDSDCACVIEGMRQVELHIAWKGWTPISH